MEQVETLIVGGGQAEIGVRSGDVSEDATDQTTTTSSTGDGDPAPHPVAIVTNRGNGRHRIRVLIRVLEFVHQAEIGSI